MNLLLHEEALSWDPFWAAVRSPSRTSDQTQPSSPLLICPLIVLSALRCPCSICFVVGSSKLATVLQVSSGILNRMEWPLPLTQLCVPCLQSFWLCRAEGRGSLLLSISVLSRGIPAIKRDKMWRKTTSGVFLVCFLNFSSDP